MLPLISCVCPTFGKTKHLNEAVESFHRQTYPNKELIIFNNYPSMDIVYDHPDVRVTNYKEDIYSIGACRNEGNKYAKGEYVCTWDDDDISLPKRLSEQYNNLRVIQKNFSDRFPLMCGTTVGAMYSESNVILKSMKHFMSSTLISRQYLIDNPYPLVDNDDQYMWYKMVGEGSCISLNYVDLYIYRWATDTYHVSGKDLLPKEQRANMMMWADASGLPNTFTITPYWERDYEQDVRDFVLSNK